MLLRDFDDPSFMHVRDLDYKQGVLRNVRHLMFSHHRSSVASMIIVLPFVLTTCGECWTEMASFTINKDSMIYLIAESWI